MGNLSSALQQLRAERKQAQARVESIDQAISVIESLNGSGTLGQSKPTDPNHIEGFTAQDGAGAKGKMGEGSEGIAASGDSENNGLGSCEAHHVSSSPQEDRGVSESAVGENKGAAEEGCLEGGMAQWKCTMSH